MSTPMNFLNKLYLQRNQEDILNLTCHIKLLYIKTRDYVILLDTGSSINLISKSYVYRNKVKFRILKKNSNSTQRQVKKNKTENEFTFVKIDRTPIKCFLFDFHKDFIVLIDAPTLKELKLI